MQTQISRRRLLGALGLLGGATLLRDFLPGLTQRASAADAEPLYFLHCSFVGGWDQLLALDPRDNTRFGDPSGGVYTAYDRLAQTDNTLSQLLAANPSGIVQPAGSKLSFGPAIGRLAEGDLWRDLAILRGVNMGTLTHDVGKRYFLTGKFPQGLTANGSSLATWWAHQRGDQSTIPNLTVGVESFNDGLSPFATGFQVRSSQDLQTVLTPLGTPLPQSSADAVQAYLAGAAERCQGQRLNADGLVDGYLAGRLKALEMVESELGALFAFSATPTDPQLQALNAAFGISTNNNTATQQLSGPIGEAMIAAQALTQGISQAVSITLCPLIDHHDDTYLTDHAPALRDGFDALADLISYLKAALHPTTQKSFWNHTLLLVTSDFARTPALNGRDGRDHHLASSCLVAGPGLRGDVVIGQTDDVNMSSVGVDLQTGESVGASGWVIRPTDVHATLLRAAGLNADHLSNQDPHLIEALLA